MTATDSYQQSGLAPLREYAQKATEHKAMGIDPDKPKNYYEALKTPFASEWKTAYEKELESLEKVGDLKVVPFEQHMKPISTSHQI